MFVVLLIFLYVKQQRLQNSTELSWLNSEFHGAREMFNNYKRVYSKGMTVAEISGTDLFYMDVFFSVPLPLVNDVKI